MENALLLAKVFLAVVFGVAGVAKLADLPGSRKAAAAFGLPERAAPLFGLLLPIFELVVAVAVLTTTFAWSGAVGALALLLLFVVAIGVNMALGRNPDCNCFGQLHSAPAGPKTLIRNALFSLPAAFVVAQGPAGAGPGILDLLGSLGSTERLIVIIGVLGLAILVAEGWLLLMLLRQNGRLMLRLDEFDARLSNLGDDDSWDAADESPDSSGRATATQRAAAHPPQGLPVGSPAPSFRLPGVQGETVSLDALLASEQPVLLLFMDPNCGPCNALMPEVGRWQREYDDKFTAAVISRGSVQANCPKVEEHGLANVMLQKNYDVSESFKVHGTPGAVVVSADGTIGSPAALGSDAIKALFAQTLYGTPLPVVQNGHAGHGHAGHDHDGHDHAGHDHAGHDHGSNGQSGAAKLGDPAPAVRLPDLAGQTVDLADLRGSQALVLFWNQGCGFCSQMLPDLQAWDANRPPDAPRLLVVSTGTPDEHRDMKLSSPVLLDPAFSVARTFGANGTPMAVLVDEQGRIASELAAGAVEVLGLANGRLPGAKDGPIQPDLPTARGAGEPAPEFSLPDLDGQTVSLAEYRGIETLVVFWNPGCGFCQRMLPDLKRWEAEAPAAAPKLLVVSSGTAEANRDQGLRSPVLLDEGFRVGSSFGASGTPSAVLVDADGKIAAPLGVGAQAVLNLARTSEDRASTKST